MLRNTYIATILSVTLLTTVSIIQHGIIPQTHGIIVHSEEWINIFYYAPTDPTIKQAIIAPVSHHSLEHFLINISIIAPILLYLEQENYHPLLLISFMLSMSLITFTIISLPMYPLDYNRVVVGSSVFAIGLIAIGGFTLLTQALTDWNGIANMSDRDILAFSFGIVMVFGVLLTEVTMFLTSVPSEESMANDVHIISFLLGTVIWIGYYTYQEL